MMIRIWCRDGDSVVVRDRLDGLRMLERKTSLVSTLLKASVYSIVLQQQMLEGEESEGGDGR